MSNSGALIPADVDPALSKAAIVATGLAASDIGADAAGAAAAAQSAAVAAAEAAAVLRDGTGMPLSVANATGAAAGTLPIADGAGHAPFGIPPASGVSVNPSGLVVVQGGSTNVQAAVHDLDALLGAQPTWSNLPAGTAGQALVKQLDGTWAPATQSASAKFVADGPGGVVNANAGAAQTLTLTDQPRLYEATLNSASCTITISGRGAGRSAVIVVTQDGTGNRALVISDGSVTTTPTINTTASAETTVYVYDDGTDLIVGTGPQGPQGIQGIQGIQGPSGAAGSSFGWTFSSVATTESTTNNVSGDLATVGPSVTVPVSANSVVLVFAEVEMGNSTVSAIASLYDGTSELGILSVTNSGYRVIRTNPTSTAGADVTVSIWLGGILTIPAARIAQAAGNITLKLRYHSGTNGTAVSFQNRKLWVAVT